MKMKGNEKNRTIRGRDALRARLAAHPDYRRFRGLANCLLDHKMKGMADLHGPLGLMQPLCRILPM